MQLIKTEKEHLPTLFQFQTSEKGIYTAAFTDAYQLEKDAYIAKWEEIIQRPSVRMQTIFIEGKIVGSIARFYLGENAEISYWIDEKEWRKGIASKALAEFLKEETDTINARCAFDNTGSQKVLEKNGFKKIGSNTDYAIGRGKEIMEYIYIREMQ